MYFIQFTTIYYLYFYLEIFLLKHFLLLNILVYLLRGQVVKRFSKRALYYLAISKNISSTVYTVPVWNVQEFLYIPHRYSIDCTGHNVQSVLTARFVLSVLTVQLIYLYTGTFCALQRFKALQRTEYGIPVHSVRCSALKRYSAQIMVQFAAAVGENNFSPTAAAVPVQTAHFCAVCTGTFCALQRFKALQRTEIGKFRCCCWEIHFSPAAAVNPPPCITTAATTTTI